MQSDDDRIVVEKAKTDPQAFSLIFDTYYKKILTYAVIRTNDILIAETIVSQTFIKARKDLLGFRSGVMPLETWLFKIVVGELRKKSGGVPLADLDMLREAQAAQAELAKRRFFLEAWRLIHNLPARYQDVLLLHFVMEKPISEIAQIIGKQEKRVTWLLAEGTARLSKAEVRYKAKNNNESGGRPHEA